MGKRDITSSPRRTKRLSGEDLQVSERFTAILRSLTSSVLKSFRCRLSMSVPLAVVCTAPLQMCTGKEPVRIISRSRLRDFKGRIIKIEPQSKTAGQLFKVQRFWVQSLGLLVNSYDMDQNLEQTISPIGCKDIAKTMNSESLSRIC